jgi:transposase
MHDKDQREALARLYADGKTRKEIAAHFDVHPDTVTTWLQREEVQGLISRFIRERTNRVLRHTDSRIEGYLHAEKDIDIDTLLKIRKEFHSDGQVESTADKTAEQVAELMKELRADPEKAKRLRESG